VISIKKKENHPNFDMDYNNGLLNNNPQYYDHKLIENPQELIAQQATKVINKWIGGLKKKKNK